MSNKTKKTILKALTYIWASIAGALTYIGSVVVISQLWNGDERGLFVAIVPMLITVGIIAYKSEDKDKQRNEKQ